MDRAWEKAMKGALGPAIAELDNAREVVETNAPINKKDGNLDQMRLELENAKSFRKAMDILSKYSGE